MTVYTSSFRFAQMITADPAVRDQWGTIWDSTVAVIEQAITGNSPINIGGTTAITLTVANNAPDQARQFSYPFTGVLTANCTVTIPGVPKMGLVQNGTTGGHQVILTTGVAGGRRLTVQPGTSTWYTCDGTNIDAPNIVTSATPVGAMMNFAGSVAPPHWLMCNGQTVSRTTYALLFTVIGTVYGAGDGTSTFALPDLRGRAMFGLDNMGGAAAAGRATSASGTPGTTLGGVGGNQMLQTHAHTITDPKHTHAITDPGHVHGVTDPSHTHTITDPTHAHTLTDPGHGHSISDPNHTHSINDPQHTHGVSDPGHRHGGSADAQGDHTHTVSGLWGAAGGPATLNSGTNIPTGNSVTTSTAGLHGHSIVTDVQGTALAIGANYTGVSTLGAATGIGIYGNTTGIALAGASTGISVTAHATGLTINSVTTHITNTSAATGITIATAGTGATQNMPPLMMVSTIIFAGV